MSDHQSHGTQDGPDNKEDAAKAKDDGLESDTSSGIGITQNECSTPMRATSVAADILIDEKVSEIPDGDDILHGLEIASEGKVEQVENADSPQPNFSAGV